MSQPALQKLYLTVFLSFYQEYRQLSFCDNTHQENSSSGNQNLRNHKYKPYSINSTNMRQNNCSGEQKNKLQNGGHQCFTAMSQRLKKSSPWTLNNTSRRSGIVWNKMTLTRVMRIVAVRQIRIVFCILFYSPRHNCRK